MWWGVLSKLAETKNNLSAFNAKSKGGRAKTKEAWPQPFSRFSDSKCCKFLALLWWLPPGLEGSSRPLHQHHHLDQSLGERCMNFT